MSWDINELNNLFALVMHMQFPIRRPNRKQSIPSSSDVEVLLIGDKVCRLQIIVQVDLV